MKSPRFNPSIDALESRTVLSGISAGTLLEVQLFFNEFEATQVADAQKVAAAKAMNTTLAADQNAINVIKVEILNFFAPLQGTNIPALENALMVDDSTELLTKGFISAQVPGEQYANLLAAETQLKTDTAAATLSVSPGALLESSINTLATQLSKALGSSKSTLIRTEISGAPTPGSVTIATAPTKGSLYYDLEHGTGTEASVEAAFIKALL